MNIYQKMEFWDYILEVRKGHTYYWLFTKHAIILSKIAVLTYRFYQSKVNVKRLFRLKLFYIVQRSEVNDKGHMVTRS